MSQYALSKELERIADEYTPGYAINALLVADAEAHKKTPKKERKYGRKFTDHPELYARLKNELLQFILKLVS